jgi:hypothetical protein
VERIRAEYSMQKDHDVRVLEQDLAHVSKEKEWIRKELDAALERVCRYARPPRFNVK